MRLSGHDGWPQQLSLQDLDDFLMPEDTSEVLTPMGATERDFDSDDSESKSTIFGRAPSECYSLQQRPPSIVCLSLERQCRTSYWSWLLLQLQLGHLVQLPNGRLWKKSLIDAMQGTGPIFGPKPVRER